MWSSTVKLPPGESGTDNIVRTEAIKQDLTFFKKFCLHFVIYGRLIKMINSRWWTFIEIHSFVCHHMPS